MKTLFNTVTGAIRKGLKSIDKSLDGEAAAIADGFRLLEQDAQRITLPVDFSGTVYNEETKTTDRYRHSKLLPKDPRQLKPDQM